eukprot:3932413-Rhodomonas_salina.1
MHVTSPQDLAGKNGEAEMLITVLEKRYPGSGGRGMEVGTVALETILDINTSTSAGTSHGSQKCGKT